MAVPAVEVVVFTYNHEAFVERALASVLSQRADFGFTVRIHDDASTDGTVDAIRAALAATDIPWELVQAPTNQYAGGTSFYHEFIAATKADFVAILDGDDYWVDDEKLNDQVGMLVRSPTAALCHHAVLEVVDGEPREVDWPPADFRHEIMPGIRLSDNNVISSSSVVLRTSMFPRTMPVGYNELGVGDYPMWALASAGHDIAFIDRPMTAYRVHAANIFASLDNATSFDRELEARIYICNNVPEEFRAAWRQSMVMAVAYHSGVELQSAQNQLEAARQETRRILGSTSWRVTAPLRAVVERLRRQPSTEAGGSQE